MAEASATFHNPYRPHLLRIAEMRDETPDVRTLTLRFDEAGAAFPAWKSGQFAEYTVFGAGECVFAIANPPGRGARDGAIECTFRAIGKVTQALRGVNRIYLIDREATPRDAPSTSRSSSTTQGR